MLMHAYNPSILEGKARGSEVQSSRAWLLETPSQNTDICRLSWGLLHCHYIGLQYGNTRLKSLISATDIGSCSLLTFRILWLHEEYQRDTQHLQQENVLHLYQWRDMQKGIWSARRETREGWGVGRRRWEKGERFGPVEVLCTIGSKPCGCLSDKRWSQMWMKYAQEESCPELPLHTVSISSFPLTAHLAALPVADCRLNWVLALGCVILWKPPSWDWEQSFFLFALLLVSVWYKIKAAEQLGAGFYTQLLSRKYQGNAFFLVGMGLTQWKKKQSVRLSWECVSSVAGANHLMKGMKIIWHLLQKVRVASFECEKWLSKTHMKIL